MPFKCGDGDFHRKFRRRCHRTCKRRKKNCVSQSQSTAKRSFRYFVLSIELRPNFAVNFRIEYQAISFDLR